MKPIIGRVSDKKLFGIVILGGYVLSLGTLAFIPIPQDNLQLFAQGVGGLSGAVGVIVAAIWKNSDRPVKEDPPHD